MDWIRRILGMSKQNPPCGCLEEDIYPLHTLDDTKIHRSFPSWVMRFNDVLDADKLHKALSDLVDSGDWRKLGGRLRLKDDGKLEIHVPKAFSADRPAVAFTHEVFSDISILEHHSACRFPKPTSCSSTQSISADLRPFARRSDLPTTIEEMIRQDAPQLSLHITSFNDATLVALTWPHTLMDAAGHQALLHSWSLTLAGREKDVPTLLGARQDVLWETGDRTSSAELEELMIERERLTGISAAMFMLRRLWEMLWNPLLDLRLIYLPRKLVAQLQSQARLEISQAFPGSDEKHFVSDGDVLTAWAARMVATSQQRQRPVTVMGFFNARYRLPRLFNSGGVYVQNMVLPTYTFLSSWLARGPVGQIAHVHRHQILEQCAEQQTRKLLETLRQDIDSGKSPRALFGPSDAQPIIFNNLTKLEMIKAADFGPAVLRRGDKMESRSNPPGTMVNYYYQALEKPPTVINFFHILGKDYGGDYWLMGKLLPRVWTKIEEDLNRMEAGV